MRRRVVWIAAAFLALTLGAPDALLAQEGGQEGQETFTVDPELAERGKTLFEQKQCMACHSIGDGVVIGPDLEGVLDRRSVDWIRKFITNPEKMIENDSIAKRIYEENDKILMPTPQATEEEIEAIIHYIAREG